MDLLLSGPTSPKGGRADRRLHFLEAAAGGRALLGGHFLEAVTLAVVQTLAVVFRGLAVRRALARVDAVTMDLGDFTLGERGGCR